MKSWPLWAGATVAVVAGGQSAPGLVRRLEGRCRFLAVNLAFRLVPHAELLYAADSGFWLNYRDAHSFGGLRVSADRRTREFFPDIETLTIQKHNGRLVHDMQPGPLGTVGHGGNSSFQAINLAAQLGAARILLAGVDFGGPHWHPDHPPGLRNPTAVQHAEGRERLDRQADLLRSWRIEVINVSQSSTLRAFPHVEPECLPLDPQLAPL